MNCPTCGSTAQHINNIGGQSWYRCQCGNEFVGPYQATEEDFLEMEERRTAQNFNTGGLE